MGLLSRAILEFYSNPIPVNPSEPDAATVVYFTHYERKGVIVMAVAGVLSCALVSTLLLYIIFSSIFAWSKRDMVSSAFTQKQVAVFVVCLLVSDLIQSISGIMQVKWAAEGRIFEGAACTTQAATLVMGDLGSTIWSCVIAAHTFSSLAIGKKWSRFSVWLIVVLGWSVTLIMTVIGPTKLEQPEKGPFFGIAGDWCFITSAYAIPRLGIHYIPLFVAAIVIFVLYGLVFLVLRGKISFDSYRIQLSPMRLDDTYMSERVSIAKRMLWYPIAYLTCILPIAIMRLVGLNEEIIPEGVWIFGMFFLFLLGAVDSVIYASTRVLIKPLKMKSNLRSIGTFSTFSRTDNIVYRSRMSDFGTTNTHGALDMNVYRRSDDDLSYKEVEGVRAENQDIHPYAASIHVTLERIQEVM